MQKSTSKAKFTSAGGGSTKSKQIQRVVCWALSLMQCCPSLKLGRFWVHSLHSWLIGKKISGRSFEDKEVSKLREAITITLSAPEPGHLAEFCPVEDNNPLFLIETFITLSRVHEVSVWEVS
jgi:hypothetical protein